ncbi:MAG: hypothetical protein ACOX52_23200 [Verrucomicrobiota bacterium]
MDRSNFTAELCQHRNNTVAVPGFSGPNPITYPFDTETDSDPAPDFASPLPFSDDLELDAIASAALQKAAVFDKLLCLCASWEGRFMPECSSCVSFLQACVTSS